MVGGDGLDGAVGDVDIAVELDALGAGGILGGGAAVVGARHRHFHGAALEIGRAVAADALSAGTRAGGGEGACVHDKELVGLDAGGSLVVLVFAVVGCSAGHLHGGDAAVQEHQGIRAHGLFHIGAGEGVDGAAGDNHGIFAADGMSGR